MEIHDILRELRNREPQKDLAPQLRIDVDTLRDLEKGNVIVTLEILAKYQRVYGIRAHELANMALAFPRSLPLLSDKGQRLYTKLMDKYNEESRPPKL